MTAAAAPHDTGPPLRLVLVDDEPLARLRLRGLAEQCPQPAAVIVGEAAHAGEALAVLARTACDALLLDVRMPGQDGLALAERLRASAAAARPAVVFVTAHASHAQQAFDLEAVDYLTKPVSRDRLHEALRRIAFHRDARAALAAAAAPATPPQPPGDGVLILQERQRSLRLPLAELLLLRAEDKHVHLVTPHGEHRVDASLAELLPRLGPGFVRVHRSAVVARHALRELQHRVPGAGPDEGWAVRLMPIDQWVPVSRRLLPALRRSLAQEGS